MTKITQTFKTPLMARIWAALTVASLWIAQRIEEVE